MTQHIQELIDRIKSDGINQAEHQAKEIERQAHLKAEDILKDAKARADKIVNEGKEEVKKMKESTTVLLQQAARNGLLSFRKDIETILKNIVLSQVRDSLTPQQLSSIIEKVIGQYVSQHPTSSTQVILSQQDAQLIKESLVAKLQSQLKKPVEFKTSADTSRGFSISFDAGKSSFDFTDVSLADYLGAYVNEDIARLLKTSTS